MLEILKELAGSAHLTPADVRDCAGLISKLNDHKDAVSQFLWTKFSPQTQKLLGDPTSAIEKLQPALLEELSKILQGPSLYDATRFAAVVLSAEIRNLVTRRLEGGELEWLNRFLLEAAYPDEILSSKQAANQTRAAANQARAQFKQGRRDAAARKALAEAQVAAQQAENRFAAISILAKLQVSTPAAEAAVGSLTAQLSGLSALPKAEATALIAQLNDATNVALGNLEKWFNSAQDRAQQWFAVHTRIWSVIAAVVAAFVLQLDTFQLFTRLSADAELRASLLNFSDTVRKQADQVFTNKLTSPALINQAALRQLKDLIAKTNASAGARIAEPPQDLDTNPKAETWLRSQLANSPGTNDLLHQFGQLAQKLTKESFNRARDEFANVTDAFSKTRFQLMPDPYPGLKEWILPWQHLLGILASAALLSLGAPFWFNTLKSLATLRPILANEVDKDPKQLPEKTGAGGRAGGKP